MGHKTKISSKGVFRTISISAVVGVLLFAGLSPVLNSGALFGFQLYIPSAAAHEHLGILGQKAPALNLKRWIDGDGKPTGAHELSDFRGKAVYLYFFQSW